MAKSRRRSKVRATSPAAIAARRNKDILGVAAAVGLPEAQRDLEHIQLSPTAVDDKPRPLTRTIRKLTRVERLLRAGVLEPHEAAACEWYADTAALAWDTTRCTANYDRAGGGGSATAPDHLAAKTFEIAEARAEYAYARRFIPHFHAPMFEAVVCHNASIATVAENLLSWLSRSQRENKVRLALKLCANRLHGGIGNRLPIA